MSEAFEPVAIVHQNKRNNKYDYLWIVQGNYGYGWEDVTAKEWNKDARQRLLEYQDNEPHYPHRLILRRVLKDS